MNRDLSKVLNHLSDEAQPISLQLLRNLSELKPPELAQLQALWPALTPERRLALMRALVDMTEEYFEYYFAPIFTWTLEDADPQVRLLALEGLWEDADETLFPTLQRLLIYDEDVDVRAAAAVDMGRLVDFISIEQITGPVADEVVETLWDVYHDPHEHLHVRRRALEGIAAADHPGVPRLIENASYDDNPLMRVSALFAMGRSADVRWIPYLLPELGSELPELRMEAARALGELEATAAVDPMIRMLDDEPDAEVRFAILEALGQIGGEKARQALQMASDSDNEAEAELAEWVLDQIFSATTQLNRLIAEVLGEESEEMDDLEDSDLWGDFYEDPLDAEIRRLIDHEDDSY